MKLSVFNKFLAKNWDFPVNTQIAWLSTMSSLVTSLNYRQKMCSQTRNSCAKAFDNRPRSKNLKPKKLRGGGGNLTSPSRLLGLIKDKNRFLCGATGWLWNSLSRAITMSISVSSFSFHWNTSIQEQYFNIIASFRRYKKRKKGSLFFIFLIIQQERFTLYRKRNKSWWWQKVFVLFKPPTQLFPTLWSSNY